MSPMHHSGAGSDRTSGDDTSPLVEAAEAGAEDLEGGEGQESAPRRKRGATPVVFPLLIPRQLPTRLAGYQESLDSAVKMYMDDLELIDQLIEQLATVLGKLMAASPRQVGVDWRPHKTRPGLHPWAYKTGKQLARKVKFASASRPNRAAKRFWATKVDSGLTWLVSVRPEHNSWLRRPQALALHFLQELLDARKLAIDHLTSARRLAAMWKLHQAPRIADIQRRMALRQDQWALTATRVELAKLIDTDKGRAAVEEQDAADTAREIPKPTPAK